MASRSATLSLALLAACGAARCARAAAPAPATVTAGFKVYPVRDKLPDDVDCDGWVGRCDPPLIIQVCSAGALRMGECEVGGIGAPEGLYTARFVSALREACPEACPDWEPMVPNAGRVHNELELTNSPEYGSYDEGMCEVWRGYCTDDWVFDECPSAAEDTRQCEVGGIFIPSEGLYTAAYVRQLHVVCAHTCDVANDVTYDEFYYDTEELSKKELKAVCKEWEGYCTAEHYQFACTPAQEALRRCEVGGMYFKNEGLFSASYVEDLIAACPETCKNLTTSFDVFHPEATDYTYTSVFWYDDSDVGNLCEEWVGHCDLDDIFHECSDEAIAMGVCEVGGMYHKGEGLYTADYVRRLRTLCPDECGSRAEPPAGCTCLDEWHGFVDYGHDYGLFSGCAKADGEEYPWCYTDGECGAIGSRQTPPYVWCEVTFDEPWNEPAEPAKCPKPKGKKGKKKCKAKGCECDSKKCKKCVHSDICEEFNHLGLSKADCKALKKRTKC